jgi:hypothetical protein
VNISQQSESFARHAEIIALAKKHFDSEDYVSAAHLLYPRIEGTLRSNYSATGLSEKPTQGSLIDGAATVMARTRHPASLLLPLRFQEYLRRVIFAGFDWQEPDGVSRHTIGHGVADPNWCDAKAVVIAFLTLHQLLIGLTAV